MKIKLDITITDEGGNEHNLYRNYQFDREDMEDETKMEESLGRGSAEMVETMLENICEHCDGAGEVQTMEKVWAGEPHEAPIGTKKCVCKLEN